MTSDQHRCWLSWSHFHHTLIWFTHEDKVNQLYSFLSTHQPESVTNAISVHTKMPLVFLSANSFDISPAYVGVSNSSLANITNRLLKVRFFFNNLYKLLFVIYKFTRILFLYTTQRLRGIRSASQQNNFITEKVILNTKFAKFRRWSRKKVSTRIQ